MQHDRHLPAIGLLAATQDRCVTRPQLLALDVPPDTIKNLLKRGYLIRVFPGVYLVGVPGLSAREFLRACLLYAGPLAFPSHRTGLELRGVLEVTEGKVVVTTKRQNVVTPVWTQTPIATTESPGILHVKQATPLLWLPTETVGGFATTLLPRTLVDFAGMEGAWPLRKAWKEASFRSLIEPSDIERQLAEHVRPGNPLIRERMKNAYPVARPGMVIKSREGEMKFLGLVREVGLPEPLVNTWVTANGTPYELDFYFEHVQLGIETDGGQHELEDRYLNDQVRRMDFFVEGIDVLHLPNRLMRDRWDWCCATVLAAYERQARRAA